MSVAQLEAQDLALPLAEIAERMQERRHLALAQPDADDEALAAHHQAFAQLDAACNADLETCAMRLAAQHGYLPDSQ